MSINIEWQDQFGRWYHYQTKQMPIGLLSVVLNPLGNAISWLMVLGNCLTLLILELNQYRCLTVATAKSKTLQQQHIG